MTNEEAIARVNQARADKDELAKVPTQAALNEAAAILGRREKEIERLREALGIAEKAIEALALTQKEKGMGLLGAYIVVPETIRRIRAALAHGGEGKADE